MVDIIEEGDEFTFLISLLHQYGCFDRIESILDIGCGCGSSIFKILGKSYCGLDLDENSMIKFEQKLDKLNGTHRLIISDFQDYDFQDQKFDLIIMNNFLNDVKLSQVKSLFKKSIKLLNYEGFLFVKVNSTSSTEINKARKERDFIVEELEPNKFFIESNNYSKNFFTKDEIIELFMENDLSLLMIKKEDLQIYPEEDIKSEFSFIGFKELE